MFSDSLSYGSLPHTLTQASITLQLKPVKINTECGSHQPISLQNSDVKILAKALASIAIFACLQIFGYGPNFISWIKPPHPRSL